MMRVGFGCLIIGFGFMLSAAGGEWPTLQGDAAERLKRDGFAVVAAKGSMANAYFNAEGPVFITSDTVLEKFGGLLRESESQQASVRSQSLRAEFKAAWKNLMKWSALKPEGDPATCKSAMFRAQMVVGTTLKLLDPDWQPPGGDLRQRIEAEARRVTDARERIKPEWLGEPEPSFAALNYPACKPLGLYAETPEDERLFRAVKFLQMIPFRLARRDELFAAAYVVAAVYPDDGNDPKNSVILNYETDSWKTLSKPALAPTAIALSPSFSDRISNKPLKWVLGDELKFPGDATDAPAGLVNNLVANVPMPALELDTRLVPPLALEDAVLFQQIMTRGQQQEVAGFLPDPLMICAWLGDIKALDSIPDGRKWWEDLVLARKVNLDPAEKRFPSLIRTYFDALESLLTEQPEASPPFMKTDAWRLKTRQAVLASWAHTRNCLAMESAEPISFGAGPKETPGFVEPVPEFYQRMGRLAERMAYQAEPPKDEDSPSMVHGWYSFAIDCHRLESMARKQLAGEPWNDAENKMIGEFGHSLLGTHDDHPRAAAVAESGVSGERRIAATGNVRLLWVNMPWHGREILCRGAVREFHSFVSSSALTDEEWQERLDSDKSPPPPAWLKPLLE